MNAADNPFATGRVERLLTFDPELIRTSWDEIDQRWESFGRRACLTGHHGAGKTSFLDAMAKRLARRNQIVRLFFNDRRSCLSTGDRDLLEGDRGAILLVDGDEHLPWRQRRQLVQKASGFRGYIFARHRSRGMPEILRLRSSLELARDLLARISPEGDPLREQDLELRFQKTRGNLRELWLDCYDCKSQQ